MKQILSTRRLRHGTLAIGMALSACLPVFAQDERARDRGDDAPGQRTQEPRRGDGGERPRARSDASMPGAADRGPRERARVERAAPPEVPRREAMRRDEAQGPSRERAWQAPRDPQERVREARSREQAPRELRDREPVQRAPDARRAVIEDNVPGPRGMRERDDARQDRITEGRDRDRPEPGLRGPAPRDAARPWPQARPVPGDQSRGDDVRRAQAMREDRERDRNAGLRRPSGGPDRDRGIDDRRNGGHDPLRRLDRGQQEARIRDERQRAERFQREREHDRRMAEQRAEQRARLLQQQRRMSQYRYQQHYHDRLREQQRRWYAAGAYDYWRDPFYYTPASYRYSYGGHWYQTNRYGADLMRRAVSYGYEEGLRAGRADRDDRWRYDVQGSYGYLDASYGYDGRYIAHDQYSYYFRQGFQRGYEDGYYGRYRYGSRDSHGNHTVLAAVLGVILGLQLLH